MFINGNCWLARHRASTSTSWHFVFGAILS